MRAFSLLKGEYSWRPLRALVVFEKAEKSERELGSFDPF